MFFQGHPEYDAISLLKEYKREVVHYFNDSRSDYPPVPEHYLSRQCRAILDEYRGEVQSAKRKAKPFPVFPEDLLAQQIDNTWHDSAEAIINNWIGQVYQITSVDRKKPLQEHINPNNPLGL